MPNPQSPVDKRTGHSMSVPFGKPSRKPGAAALVQRDKSLGATFQEDDAITTHSIIAGILSSNKPSESSNQLVRTAQPSTPVSPSQTIASPDNHPARMARSRVSQRCGI